MHTQQSCVRRRNCTADTPRTYKEYMQLRLDDEEHDVRVYEMTGIAVAWLRARKLV